MMIILIIILIYFLFLLFISFITPNKILEWYLKPQKLITKVTPLHLENPVVIAIEKNKTVAIWVFRILFLVMIVIFCSLIYMLLTGKMEIIL